MNADSVKLIVLAPGHFHAALLQKTMLPGVDSTVHVFAPEGPELDGYLALINQYNTRAENPTAWKEAVYSGPGFLDSMLEEKPGNVVVLAGNNARKTDYILQSVQAGINVLADKPMAIDSSGFRKLKEAFSVAASSGVLLYDIMTERYVVTNILQREFSRMPDVFGTLQEGTPDTPAVVFSSVHYFYKEVSGKPLIRPDWFFDVSQQGDGIVDITTHLVDLIQWECFPDTVLHYESDVQIGSAKRWPTVLTPAEFSKVTGEKAYPGFLEKDIKDSLLQVYANGEINYSLKGVHARAIAEWGFQAPEGSGDTYYSVLRGTKATLTVRQGPDEGFKAVLYISPLDTAGNSGWRAALDRGVDSIRQQYPGTTLRQTAEGWALDVPDHYDKGHEAHFALVVKQYMEYLRQGRIPSWEVAAMLAKYYTTTEALRVAKAPKTE